MGPVAAVPSTVSSMVPAAAASTGPVVSDDTIVYIADVLILVVIFLFALFSVPRAIARFSHRSEWSQGLLLRSVTLGRKPRINIKTNSVYLHSNPDKAVIDIDGHSTESFHGLPNLPCVSRSMSDLNEKALPLRPISVSVAAPSKQIWHIPMLTSFLHPVTSFLHRRVDESYSLGQVLLMAGYFVVVAVAGLYMSNPFSDPQRTGWVSISQLPFIYIFATKNNVVGMLLGIGYEKLNYLHRFVGVLAVIAANVHGIGYIYRWSIEGVLSTKLSDPAYMWGLVALGCFDLLGIFSIRFIRSKSYNLFYATHVIGFTMVLVATCVHESACVPYVIVAGVFYGLDSLARYVKTRITTATLRPIPELGLTRVEIPSINAGWHAGQHVRLRVLSTSMGLWGMTEVHPFTIANVSQTEEGLVLLCKKAGRWTSKMYEIANTASFGEEGRDVGKNVKVMVEGPYGGVGNTIVSNYSGAMFVVGGSGVTFALSGVQDLVQSGNASNVKDIQVVWSVTDPACLTPMIPLLATLISQCTTARLRISVFYTRAVTKSLEGMYLPPGITLTPGRPKVAKLLGDVVTSTISTGGANGVFVGVCGPVALAGSVSETVRTFDSNQTKTVGGIEFHEEVFGW